MTTVKQNVTALESALAELVERAQRQAEQLARAERRAEHLNDELDKATRRLARGTGDLTDAAEAATEWGVSVPTLPGSKAAARSHEHLVEALEKALRAAPMSTSEAAEFLGVPVAHAAIALRTLRRAQRVVNVGTSEAPVWCWVLGDECTTPELVARVEQLLRRRPMTLHEIEVATGARRNRVSGALVLLRRHGLKVENLGNGWKAIWTIRSKTR